MTKSIQLATIDQLTVRKMNTEKVMAHNPTLIGRVADMVFYEHPTKGDESALLMMVDGQMYLTDFWDMPDLNDLLAF